MKKLCDNKTNQVRPPMNAAFGLLQTYCGVAVGRNPRNLKDVRKAEWVMFMHKASADSSPH